MLLNDPSSIQDVRELYYLRYEAGVRSGLYTAFTYPMCTYGAFVFWSFLMTSPRSFLHSQLTRYSTFGIVLYSYSWIIANCKAYHSVNSFGIGILSAWAIVWAAALLVFTDSKIDFKRLEIVPVSAQGATVSKLNRINGKTIGGRRKGSKVGQSATNGTTLANQDVMETKPLTPDAVSFRWQSYPTDSFWQRAYWTSDLLSNYRGVAWSWKVSGLPTLPRSVQSDIKTASEQEIKDYTTSRAGVPRFDTYRAVIRHNIWLTIKGYLAIDVLLIFVHRDPYFWGLVNSPAPNWLPMVIQASPFLLRGYRLLVSMSLIWICLRTIMSWGPLFFVGILGPRLIGINGEPWIYPDHFGSYSNVFSRGLAGWWGGWWHQTFRYAFQAWADGLDKIFRIDQKSLAGKSIQLFVAFTLSGFLHASGSTTMLGDTYPWSGSFLFFFVQPFGIIAEMLWLELLKRIGVYDRIPGVFGGISNFVFTHLWFAMTGPLLTDDFARGGIWLFEPIMLSPLRGLGFGAPGDKFFCWDGPWLKWHMDSEKWWLSGIAF